MPIRLDIAKLDLMDALDLAILIEDEAYDRYKSFSDQLGYRFTGDASTFFTTMAENEKKHGQELLARREAKFGKTPMRVSRDDVIDVEAPDQGAIRADMSTLRACELALAAEQKALAFYQEALPHIRDDSIKQLFTELRDEEIEHVHMVQKAMAALPPEAADKIEQDDDETPAL